MTDEHGVDCICERCWGDDDLERREARARAAREASVAAPPTPTLDAFLDAWKASGAGDG